MIRNARWIVFLVGLFLVPIEGLAQVGTIILDSPANGATNQIVSPVLTWWTDAVAKFYRIQLSTDSSFAITKLDTTIAADTAQPKQSLVVGPLSNDSVYYWRVNGNTVRTGGTPGPWSTVFHFTTIPSLPSPPTLVSPPSGSQNLPVVDTLKWNAVAIADAYRIQLSTAFAFSTLVVDTTVPETPGQQIESFVVRGLSNAVTYYWRIYSINAAGQSLTSSAKWSFTTIIAPPGIPTLVSPAAGALSQDTANQTLTWSTTTPASSTYRLQIATDSLFTSMVLDDSTIITPSRSVSPPLHTNMRYFWRVRGKNAGGIGSFSAGRSFSSVLRPPACVSPVSGWTNLPVNLVLNWTAVPGAASYRVQMATNTSFSPITLNTTSAVDSLSVTGLSNGVTYYWRVSAVAADGDTSRYLTSPWNFKTIPSIPSAPLLTSPAQGASSQPITGLVLSWGAVTDAVTYRVQLSSDSTFGSALLVNDSTIASTSKSIPTGLLSNAGRYFWRVSAKNSAGIGPYSLTRSFSTALAQPSIVAPPNSSQNQPLSLTLNWTAVTGASSYRLQVSTINTFATLVLDQTVAIDSFSLSGLFNNTSYYWRVSARGSSGDTSAFPSTAWTFKTIVSIPAQPVLSKPLDNAKSQATTGLGLTWGAVASATSYRVQVATDTGFGGGSLFLDDSNVVAASRSVSGLTSGTRYYWRVCARNVAGAGPFSPTWSFSTMLPTAVYHVPATGIAAVPVSTTLTWGTAAGAISYRLQVSLSSTFTTLLTNVSLPDTSYPITGLAYNTKYYWRVNAQNANGDTSLYPTGWLFTTLLATPVLKSPADGAPNQPASPLLSWSKPPGADSSVAQVCMDPLFQGGSLSTQTVRDSAVMIGPLQAGTTFYWRVSAKTVNGTNSSAYSSTRSFTTAIDLPAVPIMSSPANHAVDQPVTVTLSWNTSLNGARYAAQVAPYPDSLFTAPINDTSFVSGTTRVVSGLEHYKKYFWRVSALNSSGTAQSAYSAPWDFTTVLDTPGIVAPLAPAMNVKNLPDTVDFAWSSAPLAFTYTLEVSRASSMTPLDFSVPGIPDTTTRYGPLQSNTQYFWRVRAANTLGTGQPSAIWNFTTTIAAPMLISPAGDTTGVPQTQRFSWQAVSGAAWYRLQLSTDSLFQGLTSDDSTVATSYLKTGLMTSMRYFWRVVAYSTSGGIETSPTRRFTTTITVPGVPVLSLPADDAVDQPIPVLLQWNAAVGAQTYRVQCSMDSVFTPGSIVLDDSLITATSKSVTALTSLTRYFWRVNAKNGNGISAYSQVRQFVTAMTKPDVPQLVSPVNGSVGLPQPVILNWAAEERAQRYRLQVSSSALFSSPAIDDSTLLEPPFLGGQLASNTMYFWRVAAWNPGGWSAFSPAWNFVTLIDTPARVTLVSPTDDAGNLPSNPLLTWSATARAVRYNVQISTDSAFTTLLVNDTSLTATSSQVGPFAWLPGLTRYYWRVRGGNNAGWGTFSSPRSYWTVIGTPDPVFPHDTATGISVAPTLRWHAVAGAGRYAFQLSAFADFMPLVHADSSLTDTVTTVGRLSGNTQYFWRVSAATLDGRSNGAFSPAYRFTTAPDTPLVPVLLSPPANALDVPTNVRFSWITVQFASSYQLQVATDTLYQSPIVNNMNSVDTTVSIGPLQGLRKYYWRVRGVNGVVLGPYSPSRLLTTTIGSPSPIAPADHAINQPLSVQCSWSPVDSAYRYRFQISIDSLFATTIIDDSLLTLPNRTVTGLSYLTPYYWRVRAKSARGSIGSYSAIVRFTTVIQAPVAPVAAAPASASRDLPLQSTLSWHPAARAETYRIQVSTSLSFVTPAFDDSTVADTAKTLTGLQPLTWYAWHVRASNAGGTSSYTPTWTFKTIAATPELAAPADSLVDVPIQLTLGWNASPRAVRYRLQMSTDSLFSTVTLDDSLLTTTSRRVGPLTNLTRYFWRVAALDTIPSHRSPFSDARVFTTIIAPPTTPPLLSPVSGLKGIPITPTLTWKRSPLASRYRLQVASDSVFSRMVLDDSTAVDTSRTLDSVAAYTKFFWHVRATNVGGTSAYTPTWSFTTRLLMPGLVSPPRDAIDQPVAIEFKWNPVTAAKVYRMQLSTDSTMQSVLVDDSVLAIPSKTVATLNHGTTYYWRVGAKAADGIFSGFGSTRMLTTIVDTPAAATILSPADGSKDVSCATFLRWMRSARASSYQLLVGRDSTFSAIVVVDSLLTDTVRQMASLTPLTAYWWKVRGVNRAGSGEYSSAAEFSTVIATPALTEPRDTASEMPLSVTFSWTSSPGAAGYRFQLSPDSAFASFVVNDSVSSPTRPIAGLRAACRYFWRVAAYSAESRGIFTPARAFSTALVPPAAPIPLLPESGIAGLTIRPTFHWRASTYASRYQLQISTDSPFLTTVVDDSTVVDTMFTAPPFQYLTKYYWRVRALNAKGPSAFSPISSFTTVVEAPPQPILIFPPSASTGQPTTLTLRWRPSARAVTYRLQVSTDAPFATTIVDDSTIVDTSMQVGPLDNSTTYYWRVSAKNAGWVTEYSQVWNYVIEDPPATYALNQNYPNPFNPETRIPYELPTESVVSLKIYNILGEVVKVLIEGKVYKSGKYAAVLNASDMATGVYFYRLTAGPFTAVRKLMIVR